MRTSSFKQAGKKVLASLASAALALALVPAAAFAATTEGCPSGEACTEHVAAIGTTHYDDLASAFDAAQPGDTVTLLKDYTDPAPEGWEGILAPQFVTYDLTGITFDLNGKTYTDEVPAHMFQGSKGRIENGKMVRPEEGRYALSIASSGAAKEYFFVSNVECSGGIFIYNATGVFLFDVTCDASEGFYAAMVAGNSSAFIVGGNYTTGAEAMFCVGGYYDPEEMDPDSSELTITNGTFNTKAADGTEKPLLDPESANKVVVEGGTFTADPSPYVPEEHHTVTNNGDGIWTVAEMVAQVGDAEYPTLAEAIAAGDGKTITLVNSTNETVTIPAGATITLDLNRSFFFTYGPAITNYGTLTLKGTPREGDTFSGAILGDGAGILVGSGSTTTIESGCIAVSGSAVATGTSTGATITINGGLFNSSVADIACDPAERAGEPNTITVNGGEFVTDKAGESQTPCCIYSPWKDVITVNGGTFRNEYGPCIVDSAGTVTVNGGTFTGVGDTTAGVEIGRGATAAVTVTSIEEVTDSKGNKLDGTASIGSISTTAAALVIPETVTMDNGTFLVTEVAASALKGNATVAGVSIPSSVTAIGARAFEGCTALARVDVPASVASIGKRAFAGSGITSVTVPAGATLGTGVFRGCASLKTATVEKGVKSLPAYTFKNCTSLTSVSIPAGVASIGRSAFANCTSLKSLTLPASVESVGKNVLYGASKVKTLKVKSGALTKASVKDALKGSSVTTVKVPKGKVAAYKKLFTKATCGKAVKVAAI